MARTLAEYGHTIEGYDKEPRASGILEGDFFEDIAPNSHDFVITNPPYAGAEDWVHHALIKARIGVAMLLRVQFLEGGGRYDRLFSTIPPKRIAFFANRIPFKKNIVVRNASKYFFHVWLYWDSVDPTPLPPIWIPYNAQQLLEKDSDYEA